jgi:hypothetical protein
VSGSEEYWYDDNGSRFAILKRNATGARQEIIWFIGDVEAHYDGGGMPAHVYTHPSLGTPVARIDRTGSTVSSLSVEFQFHGLGNTLIGAVGDAGALNIGLVESPWGRAPNPYATRNV